MFGLNMLKKREVKEKTPIFNIHLKITGWEGPFRDYNEFRHVVDHFNYLPDSSTIGYRVLENGKLVPGTKTGLHTYSGEIDLSEFDMHIHFKSGIGHIVKEGNSIFLKDEKDDYNAGFPRTPIYALEGLYATLPNNQRITKIRKLEKELKEQRGYEFNSIARLEKTRLKLLENTYRRKISSQ
ncbi:Uncharacterised protein [uncultured archaeon]|nr:Uncharacterised protein [uncultured archaeon]